MRSLPIFLTVALTAPYAAGQTRGALPSADVYPRSKSEWLAESARPERQVPLSENPATAGLWPVAYNRMTALTQQYNGDKVIFDEALADRLIAELYVDNGDPALNLGVQDFTLDLIDQAVYWPEERMPDAARQRLVSGLLEYVRAGGGQYRPDIQSHTAAVLDHAGYDDPEAQAQVDALLSDAFDWAEAVDNDVQRNVVSRVSEQRWGDVFALRAYDARSRNSVPPEARNLRYERAVAALNALLTDTPHDRAAFARAVRDATQTALTGFEHPAVCKDLTARLLMVYRCLLARYPRIPERISDYIQEQLLRLAAKDAGLTTAEHWRLWDEAVLALQRDRVSDRLKRWVREAAERKNLPPGQREALDHLSAVFAAIGAHSPTSEPASQPASQPASSGH
jgi:hypothetical protein